MLKSACVSISIYGRIALNLIYGCSFLSLDEQLCQLFDAVTACLPAVPVLWLEPFLTFEIVALRIGGFLQFVLVELVCGGFVPLL